MNNYKVCGVYSPEPCAEVYCVRLNFNISKQVYGDCWRRKSNECRHFCSFTVPGIRTDRDTETGEWYHGDLLANFYFSDWLIVSQ